MSVTVLTDTIPENALARYAMPFDKIYIYERDSFSKQLPFYPGLIKTGEEPFIAPLFIDSTIEDVNLWIEKMYKILGPGDFEAIIVLKKDNIGEIISCGGYFYEPEVGTEPAIQKFKQELKNKINNLINKRQEINSHWDRIISSTYHLALEDIRKDLNDIIS